MFPSQLPVDSARGGSGDAALQDRSMGSSWQDSDDEQVEAGDAGLNDAIGDDDTRGDGVWCLCDGKWLDQCWGDDMWRGDTGCGECACATASGGVCIGTENSCDIVLLCDAVSLDGDIERCFGVGMSKYVLCACAVGDE